MTQFGDDKTSKILLLDISSIEINKKENTKDFNHIFITLLNRILDKLAETVQIEFYIVALLPRVAMFVKRKEKQTLAEKFQEVIKVEKDITSISIHLGNEEDKYSTSKKNGKKGKQISESELEKKDKDPIDMESMQPLIKQLANEIIDMNKRKGKGKKPFNPLFKKKTNTSTPPPIPPNSGINLEDYSMENFCHTHHANHSKKTFPKFINSFIAMMLP